MLGFCAQKERLSQLSALRELVHGVAKGDSGDWKKEDSGGWKQDGGNR